MWKKMRIVLLISKFKKIFKKKSHSPKAENQQPTPVPMLNQILSQSQKNYRKQSQKISNNPITQIANKTSFNFGMAMT